MASLAADPLFLTLSAKFVYWSPSQKVTKLLIGSSIDLQLELCCQFFSYLQLRLFFFWCNILLLLSCRIIQQMAITVIRPFLLSEQKEVRDSGAELIHKVVNDWTPDGPYIDILNISVITSFLFLITENIQSCGFPENAFSIQTLSDDNPIEYDDLKECRTYRCLPYIIIRSGTFKNQKFITLFDWIKSPIPFFLCLRSPVLSTMTVNQSMTVKQSMTVNVA